MSNIRPCLDFRHRNNRGRCCGPRGCRRVQPLHGEPHPGAPRRPNRRGGHSLHRGLPGLLWRRQGATFDPFNRAYFHLPIKKHSPRSIQ